MPPIPPENLKPGTMYVIVFSNGVQNTMEFRGITKEGYPLFFTKNEEYAQQNIEGVTYYKVGDPDIPPVTMTKAVGGRRRAKRSTKAKAKRSRKNRHRK